MSTKTTILRESRHSQFLQAQHQDPVTYKVFAAGDRVTRCAKCLLPFLDHSWDAIGRTHCGQLASIALDNFEAPDDRISEPEVARAKATRLELAPIPNPLREVPITLR
jgi:hypothetical protein